MCCLLTCYIFSLPPIGLNGFCFHSTANLCTILHPCLPNIFRYRLLSRPKPVHWDGVRWSAVDDAKMLVGVYEHGLGNWENIRDDLNLGLSGKILPADSGAKPQASHLQTRAEYLLKLIQGEAAEKMKMKRKVNLLVLFQKS